MVGSLAVMLVEAGKQAVKEADCSSGAGVHKAEKEGHNSDFGAV